MGEKMSNQPFVVPWLSGQPNYKLVVFFTQTGRLEGGWSMTFYLNASSSSLVSIINALQSMLFNLTATGVGVPWVRATTIGQSRLASTYHFAGPTTATGGVSSGVSLPGTKVLLALASQNGGFVRQWLGGLQQNWVANGVLNPAAPNWGALLTFLTWLANNGFVIRKVASTVKTTVQSITVAGLVTAPGHALAVNVPCYVRIGRMVDGVHANGLWVALPVSTTQIQLGPSNILPFATVPVPTKTAYVSNYGYAGFPIVIPGFLAPPAQNTGAIGATQHKPGRPAYLYSGRRKTRST
jgi:hypothetical protein